MDPPHAEIQFYPQTQSTHPTISPARPSRSTTIKTFDSSSTKSSILSIISIQSIQPITSMASLWYCCGCHFGPHNSSLYDACIQCGRVRCARCVDEKISDSMSIHSHSHSHDSNPISAYPTAVSLHSPRTPTLKTTAMSIAVPELPGLQPLRRADCTGISSTSLPGTRQNSPTYMYICCACGDGPKIYNIQPRCVSCNHIACNNCEEVK